MKRLKQAKKIFDRVTDSNIFQAIVALVYILMFLQMGLYLISVTFDFDNAMTDNELFIYLVLIGLFVIPLGMNNILQSRGKLSKWGSRAYSSIYWGTVFLTGFSGVTWYLEPTNNRLEPATLLLGFAVATITFGRQQEIRPQPKDKFQLHKTHLLKSRRLHKSRMSRLS